MAGLTRAQLAENKAKEETTTVESFLTKSEVAEIVRGPTVKTAQFHVGIDMIGCKTSASHKNCDMYELPQGIYLVSKGKEKRRVIVPFTNVRAYELL